MNKLKCSIGFHTFDQNSVQKTRYYKEEPSTLVVFILPLLFLHHLFDTHIQEGDTNCKHCGKKLTVRYMGDKWK